MDNKNVIMSYYKELDKINQSKTFRRMVIKKDQTTQCVLHIKTPTCKPLITTPSKTTMNNLILFDVTTTLGKYKDYKFYDDIATNLIKENITPSVPSLREPLSDENVEEYINQQKNVKNQPLKTTERYIPYLTIDNPILKTDTTIFIDTKHGDLFYISGLKFLLDDAVDTSTQPIEIYGHAIGGRVDLTTQVDLSAPPSPSYRCQYDNVTNDFRDKINIDQTQLYQDTGNDVKAYGVVFTKELPSNTLTSNFPVLYDKTSKNSAEVQIARQDGFPSIVVQLGKLSKFFEGEPNKVFGWLLYCSTPTRINIKPNGDITNNDAILSFIIDLY